MSHALVKSPPMLNSLWPLGYCRSDHVSLSSLSQEEPCRFYLASFGGCRATCCEDTQEVLWRRLCGEEQGLPTKLSAVIGNTLKADHPASVKSSEDWNFKRNPKPAPQIKPLPKAWPMETVEDHNWLLFLKVTKFESNLFHSSKWLVHLPNLLPQHGTPNPQSSSAFKWYQHLSRSSGKKEKKSSWILHFPPSINSVGFAPTYILNPTISFHFHFYKPSPVTIISQYSWQQWSPDWYLGFTLKPT